MDLRRSSGRRPIWRPSSEQRRALRILDRVGWICRIGERSIWQGDWHVEDQTPDMLGASPPNGGVNTQTIRSLQQHGVVSVDADDRIAHLTPVGVDYVGHDGIEPTKMTWWRASEIVGSMVHVAMAFKMGELDRGRCRELRELSLVEMIRANEIVKGAQPEKVEAGSVLHVTLDDRLVAALYASLHHSPCSADEVEPIVWVDSVEDDRWDAMLVLVRQSPPGGAS